MEISQNFVAFSEYMNFMSKLFKQIKQFHFVKETVPSKVILNSNLIPFDDSDFKNNNLDEHVLILNYVCSKN